MRGAALGVKVEDDVHCTYERASYSAMFHRALRTHPRMLRELHRERRGSELVEGLSWLAPRWAPAGRPLGEVVKPTNQPCPSAQQACAATSPRFLSCCGCRPTRGCRCAWTTIKGALCAGSSGTGWHVPAAKGQGVNSPPRPHTWCPCSKTYWDADFGGVPGTVQLYANSPGHSAAVQGGWRACGLGGV